MRLLRYILPLIVLMAGVARAQTLPATTPAAPTGLTVAFKRADAVSITWTLAKTPGTTYLIERSDDGGKTWASAYVAPANYLGVANLLSGKAYAWRVTALAPTARSAPSSPVTYALPPPAPATVPAPVVVAPALTTAPATQAARHTIELAITDGSGTPAANAPYLAACGLVGNREWVGVNWHTGRASLDAIARCNAWAAAGYTVVATVTPDELASRVGTQCPDFGVAATDLATLAPGVIVQLGNEFNLPTYGIGGSFATGVRAFTLPIARRLRAIDPTRPIAGASISWQTPSYHVAQWQPLIAESQGALDYVDVHDYTLDPKNFDDVLAAGSTVAAQMHAKLMVSEWGGFRGTGPNGGEKLAPVLAAERASLEARADVSAFFVAARGGKFGDDYAWLWNPATGVYSATGKAMVASKPATQPVSLLDQLKAGTAVIDARNRAVTPLHAGAIAAYSDDQGWRNTTSADYATWPARIGVPVWIVDDETTLDAAGIAAVNARVPTLMAPAQHAGKLAGVYGPIGNAYWPYINASDPRWQAARDAIVATNAALMPMLAKCDFIVVACYPQYAETPGPASDTTTLADKIARDRAFVTANIDDARPIAKLLGKPLVAMVRACDSTTSQPLSAERADAYIDAIPRDVNVILWGDGTPENGIGDRMIARRMGAVAQ